MTPRAARLCSTCPFRRAAPKAGEIGGSVPAHDPDGMVRAAHEVTEGLKVMQCHDSTSADPRPCAGFLSVVGYESIGVRLGVLHGILRREDVGRKIRGLYGSLREMLREADDIELPGAQQDPRGGGRPR